MWTMFGFAARTLRPLGDRVLAARRWKCVEIPVETPAIDAVTRLRAEVQTAAAIRYQRMYAPGGNPFNDTFRSSRGSNLSATDTFRFVNELQWGSLKK